MVQFRENFVVLTELCMDALANAPGADSRAAHWFLVVFRVAPPALSPASRVLEDDASLPAAVTVRRN